VGQPELRVFAVPSLQVGVSHETRPGRSQPRSPSPHVRGQSEILHAIAGACSPVPRCGGQSAIASTMQLWNVLNLYP
jgi:hypothetical protein